MEKSRTLKQLNEVTLRSRLSAKWEREIVAFENEWKPLIPERH
jgi:hypothetical protein